MAIPIIPTLITLITSIPQIFKVIELLKPIKKAVIEADKALPLKVGELKQENNEAKHKHALDILWNKYGAHIERFGLKKSEVDTTIKFMVLVIRKIKGAKRKKK